MPPREARGNSNPSSGSSRYHRSFKNTSDNTDEQQHKPSRGNYRGGYRGNSRSNSSSRTEETNDTNTQKSTSHRGGHNTQRGPYIPRNSEDLSEGLPKTRVKPYKPGFIKKQKSETLPNFQIVARNDEDEESSQTSNRTKKQPFKKPNPKDLVWERSAERDDEQAPKPPKQTFQKQPFKKPNPKDLVWERPAERDDEQIPKQKLKKQPFKKPNPKDLDEEQNTQKPHRKQPFQKPNPKDLVWERPAERDDEQIPKQTFQKQPFKKPNPKDLVWERPVDKDEPTLTNRIAKKQPFKKPNPKDLVWERPAERDDEQAPKQTFQKQPFKKPNPKDLVWERPAERDDEESEHSHTPSGIHKYLDDLSHGPNIFTLPQGFSGFGSYRDSNLPDNNLFEISKPKIVNINEDEEDNIIKSDEKGVLFEDEEQDEEYYVEKDQTDNEQDEEDNHDEEDQEEDYNNFVIERKSSSSYDENDSERQILTIPPKTHEKNEKDIIYSKLKTMESKTKIWEKSYPIKANSIIGTCQDKCPKQEITNREKDNDLSLFEKTGKIIIDEHGIKMYKADPNACVKKYARSAAAVHADPSLIRPPLILKKTLEYLTHNILERKEEYHTIYFFIRDRARSIIQDLTIQDIRDERSVDLHEIISRFHIMSHHLLADVGEELSDPHQNLELMSKWLKSLQELYFELRSNGIECPNESEFTAYYILVKITSDQEVAKCLRNLPSKVSKSPEVLFALKVYGAFSTKNYVRYFELVKQASYLSACLMHMYFAHIREEALRIMNTAFNIKVTDISKAGRYPISKLVDILAFETKGECTDFCKAHGIYIDGDDVLFKYSTFVTPDKKIKSKRSLRLIESKVAGIRYSDLVNLNFRIAPEPSKTPPKELETKINESPQKIEIINPPTQVQIVPPASQPKPPTPALIQSAIPKEVIREPETKIPLVTQQPPSRYDVPHVNPPSTFVPPKPTTQENRPIFPPIVFSPSQMPPFNIIKSPNPPIPPTLIQPQPPVAFKTQSHRNEISIDPLIPQIPVSPIKPLGPTEEETKKELKSKYFSLLKKYAERKKRIRASRKQHISNAMDFVLQENIMSDDYEEDQSMCKYYKHIFKKRYLSQLYQPLDLASLIFNSPVTDKIDTFFSFFWKLMIVPGTNSTHLNEWIAAKFSRPNSDDYLCNFIVNGKDVDSLPRPKKNTELHICARTPKDSRSWRGTSSIIFILDNPNNTDLQTYFSLEKKRLHQHFSNLGLFNDTHIPILILFDKSWFHNSSENMLKEHFLHIIYEDFKCFSNVEYVGINFTHLLNFPSSEEIAILNQVLENYTLWLANNSSDPPLLHTYSIRDLIEETTFSHIRKLLIDIDPNARNGITVKDLILVYNDVCESLSHQTISETERMRKLNWPAPEFEKYCDWNTDENAILQKELLGQLSLPTIDLTLYNSKHIVDNLYSSCKQYVTTLYTKRKIYHPAISSQSIKQLVKELVNGGGYAASIKIFEMFIEIHLTLLFDKDPLYSFVFTTAEFKSIANSVLERLRYSSNPFIESSLRASYGLKMSLNSDKTNFETFRNLKRIIKESTQEKNQDCKKRKLVTYIDINQCIGMHTQLSNKISEQRSLFSHLESAPSDLSYHSIVDTDMSDTVSTSDSCQSCIDSLKLLQEKLEMYRKGI
ncbi:SAC/GANP domain-containing protein [Naegleria gruberi]|uniref:SAC/GANP domain-containing protein n=1 Tax=Naegleria gruberi TaxID=5762 RepID=D2UZY9_NAEGR|nr:SAC/GANP domain-containing protein [Naegleria gruberi]EFC50016.1 SAC/GANP domain-containing protein [Naegleria gruberi]|eukprot:XP_002682760.1 SAC/GANP domain-containing protein [Naegleria gruberi strain NEG-M]